MLIKARELFDGYNVEVLEGKMYIWLPIDLVEKILEGKDKQVYEEWCGVMKLGRDFAEKYLERFPEVTD